MFPLSDNTQRNRFPFINYAIIVINIVVFFIQITAPDFEAFVNHYAFVPARFSFINPMSYFPILYAMFMHGGFVHIISNLWFLRIFGDNVEDYMGHGKYLIFYLMGGLAAALTQYFISPSLQVPMIGASGAIAAVGGAYYVLYRNSRVKTLVTLFLIWTVVDLSASVVLGYWFLTQLFVGVGSLASYDASQGGVAFFAHIGGFVFGWLMARMF